MLLSAVTFVTLMNKGNKESNKSNSKVTVKVAGSKPYKIKGYLHTVTLLL